MLKNYYAPTEDKNNNIKNNFYEELENIYYTLLRNIVKIIIKDLNSPIGWESVYRPTIGRESLHEISNDNCVRIINFDASKNLIISSTCFPKKEIHKHIWVSSDTRTKSKIDNLLLNKRHKSYKSNVTRYRGHDSYGIIHKSI